MGIADDTSAILNDWNDDPLTIVRKTNTVSDTGQSTTTWTAVETDVRADIQPVSGDTIRQEIGETVKTTHEIFFDTGRDIRGGDRIRRTGYVDGDDEFQVKAALDDNPSHIIAKCVLVQGQAP